MRVAHLHWAFPPVIGGVETHLVLLLPELQKRFEVYLLTGAVEGKEEVFTWEGVKIRRTPLLDLNSFTPATLKKAAPRIKKELFSFVEEVKPDLLHAHNMHYFSPVHAEVLAEIKEEYGIPLVLTAHNVWEDECWRLMQAFIPIWDEVIAVSKFIQKELLKAGYPQEKTRVIYHGVDVEKFAPGEDKLKEAYEECPALKGRRVIFHPARMSLAKGSEIAVRALEIVKEEFPEACLLMCGTAKTVDWGSYQQREIAHIQVLIKRKGLEEHVFIKFIPWEKMPAFYQAAEICIYPSCFEEPFGLVMLEALAMEKPLIVTRAGGMPEIVKNGVNGLVIPRRDPVALGGACLRFLRAPAWGKSCGQRGRQMVWRRFRKETMATQVAKVYEEAGTTFRRRPEVFVPGVAAVPRERMVPPGPMH